MLCIGFAYRNYLCCGYFAMRLMGKRQLGNCSHPSW